MAGMKLRLALALAVLLASGAPAAWAHGGPSAEAPAGTPGPRAQSAEAVAGTPAPAPDPLVLDLPTALRHALESSPRLVEARSRVAEADYRVDEAYVPAYPNLGLTAGYTHIDPQIDVAFGPQRVEIVAPDNYRVGLSIQQNLLTFGRLEWGTEAAELQRQAAESDLLTAERAVLEQADLMYREAFAARQGVAVARESLEANRQQLADSEAMVKEGVAAPFDVIRSRSEVLAAESQLLVAEKRRDTAALRLAVYLGLPTDRPLELAAPPDAPPPPEGLEGVVDRAFQARPELQALRYAAEAADARVALAGAQDNPTLRLSTEYVRQNAVAFTRDYQWATGVQLAVPLFDGGLTAARVGQAEEAARQVRARMDDAQRGVRVEVESIFLDLGTAWQAVRLARQKVVELEEARRLANLRYQNGISTNLERLDAEAAWTSARFALLQSELDYQAAWTRWVRVTALGGETR